MEFVDLIDLMIYLNVLFKRSKPSFTVASGHPIFMRKNPSPSGPKSVPLFKPSLASWSSFPEVVYGIIRYLGNLARGGMSLPVESSSRQEVLGVKIDR